MKRSVTAFGTALLLGGLLAGVNATSAAAAEKPYLAAAKAGNDDKFTATTTVSDPNGTTHVRYTRTYDGLRVIGGDIVVHTEKGGTFAGASVGLAAPLALSTTAKVTAAAARAAAQKHFTGKTVTKVDTPQLVVDANDGKGVLAYETVVEGFGPDGQTPSRLHVVTDANTGAVRSSWDTVETADGEGDSVYSGTVDITTKQESDGSYSLTDVDRGNGTTCDMKNKTTGCELITSPDNTFGTGNAGDPDTAAVDAHYGAATTYDYYLNTFGRKGIFDDGTGVPSRVHYGESYVNAYWDGEQMTYGDGQNNTDPLVALDVAAHEMSHGVTEHTANLTYTGESGGLNEATSDIFGSMVEFSANNTTDSGDYEVGEEIDINGDGSPLRYMYDPAKDGGSQSCWSTDTATVDVHYSSGVGNHFFFDLAEGTGSTSFGTSPVCGDAAAVTGIGRDKAAAIWYKALTGYFTSSTDYAAARGYTLSAATDLYGECGTEYKAVQASWTAVNVAGTDKAC